MFGTILRSVPVNEIADRPLHMNKYGAITTQGAGVPISNRALRKSRRGQTAEICLDFRSVIDVLPRPRVISLMLHALVRLASRSRVTDRFQDHRVIGNNVAKCVLESGNGPPELRGALQPDFLDDLPQAGAGPFHREEVDRTALYLPAGHQVSSVAVRAGRFRGTQFHSRILIP